jgi:hypothetical protein
VNGLASAPTASSINDTWWGAGDEIACIVTPTDGSDDGAAVTSNIVTIGNTAPSITGVSISPTAPLVSDTLTCSTTGSSDADGDAEQTTYAWSVNGTAVGTGSTLSGAFAVGDTVTCTATPFDGTDSGAPMSVDVDVANALPVLATPAPPPPSPSATPRRC